MTYNNQAEELWRAYLASLPAGSTLPDRYEAWAFGDNPAMADELADLVLRGIKTATASLLWGFEADGDPLPKAGDFSLILDGAGAPVCVIQTTQVEVMAFSQVDAGWAYDEGEGDRSLQYWREGHWRFFSRWCERIGRTPSETMPVVCERFKVVFKNKGKG
jgi:uncharacterized protein YhfF